MSNPAVLEAINRPICLNGHYVHPRVHSVNAVETYYIKDSFICKSVKKRNNSEVVSKVLFSTDRVDNYRSLSELYDKSWLKCNELLPSRVSEKKYFLADLFAGIGGMTMGVVEAGRCLGIDVIPKFANDFNQDAILTYKHNFASADIHSSDISEIIDGEINEPLTPNELALKERLGEINIVIGGPPCQGNSDLNNHTRRNDKKNTLLLKVVRFAEIFSPEHLIIENVQGVRHDKGQVTEIAKSFLKKLGYKVHEGLLTASQFGVAQNRRRYFMVASKSEYFDFNQISILYSQNERSFNWACSDLLDIQSDSTFDTSAQHSVTNQKRIDYLFAHDLHELPNSERPDCHKDGKHSYNSVYGRMYLDKPSPTITSGFGSIGQGRFCHPLRKRSITPHEAARLQFIPDFFKFLPNSKRVSCQKMIGNAVPSKLSYLLTLELLR
jgi:DNA (cytosine-5)-methyltransferase 1